MVRKLLRNRRAWHCAPVLSYASIARPRFSYSPPHVREFRGKSDRVRGYFRLSSNAKHDKQRAFAIFESLAVRGARSQGLIEMLSREVYCFRLLAINDNRGATRAPLSAAVTEPFDANTCRSISFSSNPNRLLRAYLNTARRVIRLRSVCGDYHTLLSRLRLVFSGAAVDLVRVKPRPFRAGKDSADGIAVLWGAQCGVRCCSMY